MAYFVYREVVTLKELGYTNTFINTWIRIIRILGIYIYETDEMLGSTRGIRYSKHNLELWSLFIIWEVVERRADSFIGRIFGYFRLRSCVTWRTLIGQIDPCFVQLRPRFWRDWFPLISYFERYLFVLYRSVEQVWKVKWIFELPNNFITNCTFNNFEICIYMHAIRPANLTRATSRVITLFRYTIDSCNCTVNVPSFFSLAINILVYDTAYP